MKFSLLARGKAAEHEVAFPVVTADGTTAEAKCLVRPLVGDEEAVALAFATDYAKKRGASEATAKSGNPLWDLGYMIKVLHLGCVDPDSPKDKREPFFDGGAEQIGALLDRETIAFLFELQQHWQDMASPTIKRLNGDELLMKIREVAETESEIPFLQLAPGLRWIFTRSMARMLWTSPEASSPSSSSSERSGPTSSSEPPSADDPSASSSPPPTDSPTNE